MDSHVHYIISQCAQRIYLLKLLRHQGMSGEQLSVVTYSIIVSISIFMCFTSVGGFLSAELMNKMNAVLGAVVASSGRSKRVSRAVEGVRRSVFCWLLSPWISLTVTGYNARYINQYVNLFTTPITIHTPLVLDCRHSKRTLRTLMRKLHTLMRKCLPQHLHNSPLRPALPRLLRRAIPRQALTSHSHVWECEAYAWEYGMRTVKHGPAPTTRRRRRRCRRGSNWRLKRFGYTTCNITVSDLMDTFGRDLFRKLCSSEYSLHHLLPAERKYSNLRNRGLPYELPEYCTNLHKVFYYSIIVFVHLIFHTCELSFNRDFAPCWRAFDMSNKYYLLTYLLTSLAELKACQIFNKC